MQLFRLNRRLAKLFGCLKIWSNFFIKQIKNEQRINTLLNLAMLVVAIVGIYLALPQLDLIRKQLEDLNSKGVIVLSFFTPTSTPIEIGSDISSTFDIDIRATNVGSSTPTTWRASVWFCNHIAVMQPDSSWASDGNEQFATQSEKILIPQFELAHFGSNLDTIGKFKISLKEVKKENFMGEGLPLAITTTSGQKTEPYYQLISLKHTDENNIDYYSEKAIANNGVFQPNLDKCYPIQSNE